VDVRREWKAWRVTVGGTGEKDRRKAVKKERLKRTVLSKRQLELWLDSHGSAARQRDDIP
jgi:hypothetical protein